MTIITCSVQKTLWLAPNIMGLTCIRPDHYTFIAGQYAPLQTHDMPEARAYSIASSENGNTLNFHIRIAPHSPTAQSFKKLSSGDILNIYPAQGKNTLSKTQNGPLILIGGGVGIAPLYSIILTALEQTPERQITLFWGSDNIADLYLHNQFISLAKTKDNFHYIPVCLFSASGVAQGQVTDHIFHEPYIFASASIHIAGPKEMMQHSLHLLEKQGVPETSIFYDKFW